MTEITRSDSESDPEWTEEHHRVFTSPAKHTYNTRRKIYGTRGVSSKERENLNISPSQFYDCSVPLQLIPNHMFLSAAVSMQQQSTPTVNLSRGVVESSNEAARTMTIAGVLDKVRKKTTAIRTAVRHTVRADADNPLDKKRRHSSKDHKKRELKASKIKELLLQLPENRNSGSSCDSSSPLYESDSDQGIEEPPRQATPENSLHHFKNPRPNQLRQNSSNNSFRLSESSGGPSHNNPGTSNNKVPKSCNNNTPTSTSNIGLNNSSSSNGPLSSNNGPNNVSSSSNNKNQNNNVPSTSNIGLNNSSSSNGPLSSNNGPNKGHNVSSSSNNKNQNNNVPATSNNGLNNSSSSGPLSSNNGPNKGHNVSSSSNNKNQNNNVPSTSNNGLNNSSSSGPLSSNNGPKKGPIGHKSGSISSNNKNQNNPSLTSVNNSCSSKGPSSSNKGPNQGHKSGFNNGTNKSQINNKISEELISISSSSDSESEADHLPSKRRAVSHQFEQEDSPRSDNLNESYDAESFWGAGVLASDDDEEEEEMDQSGSAERTVAPSQVDFNSMWSGNQESVNAKQVSIGLSDVSFASPWVGREEELTVLGEHNNGLVLISGLPGVGKTQLALRYLNQESSCDVGFFTTQESAAKNFIRLIKTILPGENLTDPALKSKLYTALNKKKTVLIFDGFSDVKDIKHFLPSGDTVLENVCIVVTSQFTDWPSQFHLPLSPFQPELSLKYLELCLPSENQEDLKLLAEDLGFLPAALETAVHFIRHTKKLKSLTEEDYNIKSFREELKSDPEHFFNFISPSTSVSLAVKLKLLIPTNNEYHCKNARTIFNMLCFCDTTQDMPVNLFVKMPDLKSGDHLEALLILKERSMIQQNKNQISVNSVVALVNRWLLENESAENSFEEIFKNLTTIFLKSGQISTYLHHIFKIWSRGIQLGLESESFLNDMINEMNKNEISEMAVRYLPQLIKYLGWQNEFFMKLLVKFIESYTQCNKKSDMHILIDLTFKNCLPEYVIYLLEMLIIAKSTMSEQMFLSHYPRLIKLCKDQIIQNQSCISPCVEKLAHLSCHHNQTLKTFNNFLGEILQDEDTREKNILSIQSFIFDIENVKFAIEILNFIFVRIDNFVHLKILLTEERNYCFKKLNKDPMSNSESNEDLRNLFELANKHEDIFIRIFCQTVERIINKNQFIQILKSNLKKYMKVLNQINPQNAYKISFHIADNFVAKNKSKTVSLQILSDIKDLTKSELGHVQSLNMFCVYGLARYLSKLKREPEAWALYRGLAKELNIHIDSNQKNILETFQALFKKYKKSLK